MSYPLLEQAPKDHLSDEFLVFLKQHNVVVDETRDWLVIENIKYHKPESPWLTAFAKVDFPNFNFLVGFYRDWRWLKKPVPENSVARLHIHLIPPEIQ